LRSIKIELEWPTQSAAYVAAKFVRARNDPRRRQDLAANPLWTLEELYNLRNPPFVADPEFTPLQIDALGCDPKSGAALPGDPTEVRFPIAHLVGGLPWRYTEYIKRPGVSNPDFAPLDLSCIGR
jgi:hypothetical protein